MSVHCIAYRERKKRVRGNFQQASDRLLNRNSSFPEHISALLPPLLYLPGILNAIAN